MHLLGIYFSLYSTGRTFGDIKLVSLVVLVIQRVDDWLLGKQRDSQLALVNFLVKRTRDLCALDWLGCRESTYYRRALLHAMLSLESLYSIQKWTWDVSDTRPMKVMLCFDMQLKHPLELPRHRNSLRKARWQRFPGYAGCALSTACFPVR